MSSTTASAAALSAAASLPPSINNPLMEEPEDFSFSSQRLFFEDRSFQVQTCLEDACNELFKLGTTSKTFYIAPRMLFDPQNAHDNDLVYCYANNSVFVHFFVNQRLEHGVIIPTGLNLTLPRLIELMTTCYGGTFAARGIRGEPLVDEFARTPQQVTCSRLILQYRSVEQLP